MRARWTSGSVVVCLAMANFALAADPVKPVTAVPMPPNAHGGAANANGGAVVGEVDQAELFKKFCENPKEAICGRSLDNAVEQKKKDSVELEKKILESLAKPTVDAVKNLECGQTAGSFGVAPLGGDVQFSPSQYQEYFLRLYRQVGEDAKKAGVDIEKITSRGRDELKAAVAGNGALKDGERDKSVEQVRVVATADKLAELAKELFVEGDAAELFDKLAENCGASGMTPNSFWFNHRSKAVVVHCPGAVAASVDKAQKNGADSLYASTVQVAASSIVPPEDPQWWKDKKNQAQANLYNDVGICLVQQYGANHSKSRVNVLRLKDFFGDVARDEKEVPGERARDLAERLRRLSDAKQALEKEKLAIRPTLDLFWSHAWLGETLAQRFAKPEDRNFPALQAALSDYCASKDQQEFLALIGGRPSLRKALGCAVGSNESPAKPACPMSPEK